MELGLIPELIQCDDDSDDDRGADAARAHPFFGLPLPLTWRTRGAVPSCIADLPLLPPHPPAASGHDDVAHSTGRPHAAPPAPPATTGRGGMRPLLTAVSLTSGDETGARVASVASYAPAGETLLHAADNGSIVRGQIVVPSARLAAARSAFAFYFSGKTLPDMANVNEHITDQLTALVSHYDENKGDPQNAFRASNTKLAVQFLKRLPRRLHRIEDLDRLIESAPKALKRRIKIGESTRRKIAEILDGQQLAQLAFKDQSRARTAAIEFQKLHGIGPVKARMLVEAGIHSIAELRTRVFGAPGVPPNPPTAKLQHGARSPILLDDSLACLPHFEDLTTRIPRDEVTEIVEAVRAAAHEALRLPPHDLLVVCCGSYRRGRPHSGDVDILFAPQQRLPNGGVLPLAPVLEALTRSGFLVAELRHGQHDYVRTGKSSEFMRSTRAVRDAFELYRSVAAAYPDAYSLPIAVDQHAARGVAGGGDGPAGRGVKRPAPTDAGVGTGAADRDEDNDSRLGAPAGDIRRPASKAPRRGDAAAAAGGGGGGGGGEAWDYATVEAERAAHMRAAGDQYAVALAAAAPPARGGGGGGARVNTAAAGRAAAAAGAPSAGRDRVGSGAPRVLAFDEVQWCERDEYDVLTFMGLCRLPPGPDGAPRRVRRIDIKSYPRETFASAIMYFTGSDYFNRSMRSYVKQAGWSLSDSGLRVVRFKEGDVSVKVLESAPVRTDTEEDIFAALGVPYRAPVDRDCDGGTKKSSGGGGAAAGAAAAAAAVPAGDGGGGEDVDDDSQRARRGGAPAPGKAAPAVPMTEEEWAGVLVGEDDDTTPSVGVRTRQGSRAAQVGR